MAVSADERLDVPERRAITDRVPGAGSECLRVVSAGGEPGLHLVGGHGHIERQVLFERGDESLSLGLRKQVLPNKPGDAAPNSDSSGSGQEHNASSHRD